MKQILQSYRDGEIWLADVPSPVPGDHSVLVRTAASVVSAGTERMITELAKKSLAGKALARPDLVRKVFQKIKAEGLGPALEKAFSKLDTPIPLGYACSGAVLRVGRNVTSLRPGDRVACAGAGSANHAEYDVVPQNLCVPLPAGVSFEDGAFATLGAIALQGVRQADVRLGERVAVIGLGLLGLLTVQLLKAAGCAVLGCDPNADRCRLARELGADETCDPASLPGIAEAFSRGRGADAVLITAATPSDEPIAQAAAISRAKGRVVVVGLVGMNVPRDAFYAKELDLRLSMSYGPGRYDREYEELGRDYPPAYVRWTEQRNLEAFLDLVAAGRVTPSKLVTHRFGIDQALGAYELLEGGKEPYLGIVIQYPDGPQEPAARIDIRPPAAVAGKIGVGLVGAGNFARAILLPNLKRVQDAELVTACDLAAAAASDAARKFGFARAATSADEVIADADVRAVFITTRHAAHAPLAVQALKAGKSVFVEKPLALTGEELEQVEQALAASPGCLLQAGFNRRFSPAALAVRDFFAGISEPITVTARINAGAIPAGDWIQDPDEGGGRIIGEGCHWIDLATFLTGAPPVRVFAESVAGPNAPEITEDQSFITVRHANGSISNLAYLSKGDRSFPKERIEVLGGGRLAVIDDFRSVTLSSDGRTRTKRAAKQDKGYANELAAFFSALKAGGPAPIPWEDLRSVTLAAISAVHSLRQGVPVDVP